MGQLDSLSISSSTRGVAHELDIVFIGLWQRIVFACLSFINGFLKAPQLNVRFFAFVFKSNSVVVVNNMLKALDLACLLHGE